MSTEETALGSSLRTGFAAAVTVGLFYALCTLAWAVSPEAFLNFMNGLFHGIDFKGLVQAKPFSIPGFLTALIVLSIWALLAGTFFAWLRQRLAP